MKLPRGLKRTIIIIVYLILFALIGWGAYDLFTADPNCSDGKKNQNELGVDCGGVCGECERELVVAELVVEEKAFVPGSTGKYDLVARVTNPNIDRGSANFSYEFSLLDASGNVLARKAGRSYILPKETKYVIDTEVESAIAPASVAFVAKGENWQTFSGYEEPQLLVRDKKFNLKAENIAGSDAYGLVINDSPFDFNAIRVNIIVRDGMGKVVALGVTQMSTLNSNERRDFRITWPDGVAVGETAVEVEMEPEANVFDSQNFIKKYIPLGIQAPGDGPTNQRGGR